MSTSLILCLIGSILLVLSPLFLSILLDARSRKIEAAQRQRWKTLTRSNPALTFESVATNRWIFPREDSSVVGTYRDCHLTLKTILYGTGDIKRTHTQITIFPHMRTLIDPQQMLYAISAPGKDDLALLLFPDGREGKWNRLATIVVKDFGDSVIYREPGVVDNIAYLEAVFDRMIDLSDNYPQVLALGGEAVPGLVSLYADSKSVFKEVILQLLNDISGQSKDRWAERLDYLICPGCFTRVDELAIKLARANPASYYGCRICGQNKNFLEAEKVVAILDSDASEKLVETNDGVYINWLAQRTLFDFDVIEIKQATDEEIERFVVQIGNDTDEWRTERYPQVTCTVFSTCELSANTHRILEQQFQEIRWV